MSSMKYVSASQITTFSDCPRKWYLNKIVGLESPSSPSTELGSAVHEILEQYLRDGVVFPETKEGQIAKSGLIHLPSHREQLEIEVSLVDMPLTDSPVEVRGFVDVIRPRAHEIIDHKTSSNKKYTKTKRELKQNVQLILYARAYLERVPECDEVQLTHIYYGTKTRWAKRVSVKLSRANVLEQWDTIKSTIHKMMNHSDAENASLVPPNYDSCDKYGGCPFAGQCFNAKNYTPTNETTNEETAMTPEQRMLKLGLGEPKPTTAPKAPTAPKATNVAKILYIGCFPLKGTKPPTYALDAYRVHFDDVCSAFNVPHVSLVDYGKGWSALVAKITEAGWPPSHTLYLDPISKEYEHLVSVLSSLADIVIKRL